MKKYILLLILVCGTFALGAFMLNSAHTNSVLSSELEKGKIEIQVADKIVEDNSVKETIIEFGSKTTTHIAEYLFSIIYK